LLLVQQSRLKLSDNLSQHVSDLPQWAGQVTISQLVHHTSGIPDYISILNSQGFTDAKVTTQRQALRALKNSPTLEFAPGSRFSYSNSNYILLAEVASSVADKPLPAFLTQRFFRPAGLEMVRTRQLNCQEKQNPMSGIAISAVS
jgi:CubicO group peptidase (beta-lactamase class C family)